MKARTPSQFLRFTLWAFTLFVLLQFASFLSTRFWLTDVLAEFVFHFCLGFACFAVWFAWARRRGLCFGALLGLAVNLYAMLPLYYPVPSIPSVAQTTLNVVQFNAFYKNPRTKDFVTWAKAQRDVDVVVVFETETNGPALEDLKENYPYSIGQEFGYLQGMAVFSRTPLSKAVWLKLLPKSDVNQYALSFELKTAASKQPVRVIAVHPPNSVTRAHWEQRNLYFEKIAELVGSETAAPQLVVGDFNNSAWHPALLSLQRKTGLTNAQQGRGLMFTWHSVMMPSFITGLMIDHLLINASIKVVDRQRIDDAFGSDHMPVLTKLAID